MTIRELWTQLVADYALSSAWLAEELAAATVTAAVVDGATTITATTGSPALPWLQRCGKVASRKASAIAGRRVVVRFVLRQAQEPMEVGE